MLVSWVWGAEDEREDTCHRRYSRNISYGIIETNSFDKVTKDSGVDHTSHTGTAGNVAYGKASALRKPCRSN